MDWKSLLWASRQTPLQKPQDMPDKYPTNDFDADYWKIVNSAPFRRLQDKTQVFPLDKSDFVRTRLTHSMETSALGKQLATMIMQNVQKRDKFPITPEQAKDAASAVMCAGLLHDIGNPPFGHFGEVVIGDWFKKNLGKIFYKGKPLALWWDENDQRVKDLCHFEGNAQALRLLSKVYRIDGGHGMNLMPAVVNTLVKYPINSCQVDDKNKDIKFHKLGYYKAEQELFDQLAEKTGTKMADGSYQRHPLTYILEAADDIAYATADLEDAYKKGLFRLSEFEQFFVETLKRYEAEHTVSSTQFQSADKLISLLKNRRKNEESTDGSMLVFQRWIAETRDWLLYTAAYGFSPYKPTAADSYEQIMEGCFQKEILSDTFHGGSIRILKDAMKEFVYDSPNILTLELAAQTILTSLLDKFIPAVLYLDNLGKSDIPNNEKPSVTDRKFINLLSKNQLDCYQSDAEGKDEAERLYLRMLLVTDFISGMTDSYAKNLYQELAGIY